MDHRLQGFTLIDITQTGTLASESSKSRNQQRNWETISQILGLRTQLLDLKYVGMESVDLSQHSFGIDYHGIHNVWSFEFAVEYDDVYSLNSDRYGALKNDFKIAPIILGLDETVNATIPLFAVSGPNKNIYFKTLV